MSVHSSYFSGAKFSPFYCYSLFLHETRLIWNEVLPKGATVFDTLTTVIHFKLTRDKFGEIAHL